MPDDIAPDVTPDAGAQTPTPETTAPTPPSAEDIASIVSQSVQQTMQSQQPPPPPMTPEERAEHMRVWNPTPEFADSFRNAMISEEATPEQRMKAFNDMREGLMQQAYRGAELIAQELLQNHFQQIQPLLSSAQQVQQEQTWNKFTTAYPVLKDQKDLVDAVSTQLVQQGFKPRTAEEGMKKVAETVEAILKRANPNFSIKNQQQAGMPQMAGTSMPGGAPVSTPTSSKRGGLASFFGD